MGLFRLRTTDHFVRDLLCILALTFVLLVFFAVPLTMAAASAVGVTMAGPFGWAFVTSGSDVSTTVSATESSSGGLLPQWFDLSSATDGLFAWVNVDHDLRLSALITGVPLVLVIIGAIIWRLRGKSISPQLPVPELAQPYPGYRVPVVDVAPTNPKLVLRSVRDVRAGMSRYDQLAALGAAASARHTPAIGDEDRFTPELAAQLAAQRTSA